MQSVAKHIVDNPNNVRIVHDLQASEPLLLLGVGLIMGIGHVVGVRLVMGVGLVIGVGLVFERGPLAPLF